MCVFSDTGELVDVGAGEGLRGYRVFVTGRDEDPGDFSSPVQSQWHWKGSRLRDGSYLIDGPSQVRAIPVSPYVRPSHNVREYAQGFYVVDDPAEVQGHGVLLAVRPAGECVRHEYPGGWRASSLVVEGAVVFEPHPGLERALAILRGDGSARLSDLASRLEREGTFRPGSGHHAPPTWLNVVTVPAPAGRFETAATRWARSHEGRLFPAMYYYDNLADGRILVRVPDGGTAEKVNAYLARVQDPDASRTLADYVADVVAERAGAPSARLMLESKFQRDLDHAAIARRALEQVDATVPAAIAVPPSEVWTEDQLIYACREAERRYRKSYAAAKRARLERERFGRELERRLRRDPRGVVAWLREQPANVRKREGIVRSAVLESVRVRHAGESWQVTNYAPDIVRLELAARGSHVNVYARWTAGKWHPCGTAFEDYTSGGWSGMSFDHRRGPLLARILGQKWDLLHLEVEEAGGRWTVDRRALLPVATIARIKRERERAQARVRQLVGA